MCEVYKCFQFWRIYDQKESSHIAELLDTAILPQMEERTRPCDVQLNLMLIIFEGVKFLCFLIDFSKFWISKENLL